MTRAVRRGLFAAAVCSGLALIGAYLALPRRGTIVRVDRGPVGERIVARAVVVPSEGVLHVFAGADGRVLRVAAREGELVDAGQLLAELEVSTRKETLVAPARGVVLVRHAEVGDYALAAAHGAQMPLFELADPSRTELRVEVEEADAARLVPKLPVVISGPGGASLRLRGQVERVSGQLERRTIGADDARVRADGMVRVVSVSWPLAERPVWPLGARAEAGIELGRREVSARVPRAALTVRDGRAVVERPVAFWTREASVEIMAVDEAFAEIRGLPVGTEVVIPKGGATDQTPRAPDRVDSIEAVR